MTAEKLTEAIYDYLLASCTVDDVPMGAHAPNWPELQRRFPADAARWRTAVQTLLLMLGFQLEDLNAPLGFSGELQPAPRSGDASTSEGPKGGTDKVIRPDDSA